MGSRPVPKTLRRRRPVVGEKPNLRGDDLLIGFRSTQIAFPQPIRVPRRDVSPFTEGLSGAAFTKR